jgi:hypothetical protein
MEAWSFEAKAGASGDEDRSSTVLADGVERLESARRLHEEL